MSKNIIFAVILLSLQSWSVFGLDFTREDREKAVRYTMIAKVKAIITEKLWGMNGRSARNEQELLDSCKHPSISELEDDLKSKQKIISSDTQQDFVNAMDIEPGVTFNDRMKQVENDVLESSGLFAHGYCDMQAGKCNDKDSSCKGAVSLYEGAFRSILADRSALTGGVKGLCDKMMKAIAGANKNAVSEIEMCRLEQDNVAEKAQTTEEKIIQDQKIEMQMLSPQKPVKKYEDNSSAPGSFKRSSGASAQ